MKLRAARNRAVKEARNEPKPVAPPSTAGTPTDGQKTETAEVVNA